MGSYLLDAASKSYLNAVRRSSCHNIVIVVIKTWSFNNRFQYE